MLYVYGNVKLGNLFLILSILSKSLKPIFLLIDHSSVPSHDMSSKFLIKNTNKTKLKEKTFTPFRTAKNLVCEDIIIGRATLLEHLQKKSPMGLSNFR